MGNAGSKHDFVIVIPVADRPQHLADCLDSLLNLYRRHPYAGSVSVLIADDSEEPENITRHRALAERISREGLPTHHLGQAEQRALIDALPADLRARLADVIGDKDADVFHHKGASITRNIAYLWLARQQSDGKKRLFWFIDSDQEFRVNSETTAGDEQPCDLDYFHWLDRIFSETPARVLTGKVVGDPPVSPAVMAGTFLDDVIGFLGQMASLAPHAHCAFHGQAAQSLKDAAYHDMAELFGFKPTAGYYPYRCPVPDRHDHAACFSDFARRLQRFFDGEHPTRRSFYQADNPMASIKPARTIYTGNYVLTDAGLQWFIPFAALKLRMAGPTLGRLVKAQLGDRFISANLPMLHKRTVEALGLAEFRPGITRSTEQVDLSGEFERQYFGDVLLFTLERLTERGYPGVAMPQEAVAETVHAIEAGMLAKYTAQHGQIAQKISQLATLFSDPSAWWQQDVRLTEAREAWVRFIGNMQANFADDSPAWRVINSTTHRQARKAAMGDAIGRYRDDRDAWQLALKHFQP
jgi:hypothetical protein